MRILEEMGVAFLNSDARAVLRKAGCFIDRETV